MTYIDIGIKSREGLIRNNVIFSETDRADTQRRAEKIEIVRKIYA